MRLFIYAMAILNLCAGEARASEPILGHWFFYKKIYLGHEMPEPPSATLRMHFEFEANGVSVLYWWHEGEGDFCRRRGKYSVQGSMLVDEVIWVDPDNSEKCSDDPDMQLGRKTKTPYYFRGPDLALKFHIGDEELDLVWKKLEEK